MVAMVAYAIQGCQELIQIAMYFIMCETLLIPFHIEDAMSSLTVITLKFFNTKNI